MDPASGCCTPASGFCVPSTAAPAPVLSSATACTTGCRPSCGRRCTAAAPAAASRCCLWMLCRRCCSTRLKGRRSSTAAAALPPSHRRRRDGQRCRAASVQSGQAASDGGPCPRSPCAWRRPSSRWALPACPPALLPASCPPACRHVRAALPACLLGPWLLRPSAVLLSL